MPTYLYLSNKDPESKYLQHRVEEGLAGYGYRSLTSGFLPGLDLADEIGRSVRNADLIIADISNRDPDLFFELGIAFASRKPLILLVKKAASVKIPTDLTGHIFIPYDDASSPSLMSNILNIIRNTRI